MLRSLTPQEGALNRTTSVSIFVNFGSLISFNPTPLSHTTLKRRVTLAALHPRQPCTPGCSTGVDSAEPTHLPRCHRSLRTDHCGHLRKCLRFSSTGICQLRVIRDNWSIGLPELHAFSFASYLQFLGSPNHQASKFLHCV